MGETQQQHNYQTPAPPKGLRLGEIVEVQGGHIVRSTGRKDRHSKVCTAKGPRDRRVRLSAHTAIQFYDVQDRLGYDRPSKAVDWLIKKAKSAIDELDELPAWDPTSSAWAHSQQNVNPKGSSQHQQHDLLPVNEQHELFQVGGNSNNGSGGSNNGNNNSSFLPPSMDSDSIADTIKSFFPMGGSSSTAAAGNNTSSFHNSFAPAPPQDLRLSLQSFDDHPILIHSHASHAAPHQQQQQQADIFGPGLGFDVSWSDQQRMVAWNPTGDGGVGGFVFNAPPLLQPLLLGGQNQSNSSHQNSSSSNNHQFVSLSSQRGPLQSSNTQSIRAWIDPTPLDNHHQHYHQYYHQSLPVYPASFGGGGGGFSGFHFPARIEGEREEHDGVSDKPSSASSDSTRH